MFEIWWNSAKQHGAVSLQYKYLCCYFKFSWKVDPESKQMAGNGFSISALS